jgi:ribonuclease E
MKQKKKKYEDRKILFNTIFPEEARAVIASGGVVEHFEIENQVEKGIVGNIYIGEVENVEPALHAAFVNYGGRRNGFLPFNEISPPALVSNRRSPKRKKAGEKENRVYLKKGDRIIVQVEKDESPLKGAVLTSYVSIAGRYLVLMLGMKKTGISKRIIDEKVRNKIKQQVEKLKVPENMGVIVRTVGANRKLKEFREDLKNLRSHMDLVKKRAKEMPRPGILYAEQDLVTRILRDHYDAGITRIVVDTEESYERALNFLNVYSPKNRDELFMYKETTPIYEHYGIEEGIEGVFSKRVPLPSGGFLIIDVTEAFVTIDVNSGKSVKEKDIEETAYKTNLESAKVIPGQLALRDLGGIIVIDFIDMEQRNHKREVEKTVREGMRHDRARNSIGPMGKFSLMSLTRQRLGSSSLSLSYENCDHCDGEGKRKKVASVSAQFFREVMKKTANGGNSVLKFSLSPSLFEYIVNQHSDRIKVLQGATGVSVELKIDISLRGYSFSESSP